MQLVTISKQSKIKPDGSLKANQRTADEPLDAIHVRPGARLLLLHRPV